jgi:hypothetical protein
LQPLIGFDDTVHARDPAGQLGPVGDEPGDNMLAGGIGAASKITATFANGAQAGLTYPTA